MPSNASLYSLTLMQKGKKSKAEFEWNEKSFDPTNEVRQGFIYHAQNLVIFAFQALV